MGIIYLLQVLENIHYAAVAFLLMSIGVLAMSVVLRYVEPKNDYKNLIKYTSIVLIISTVVAVLTPDNVCSKYEAYQRQQNEMQKLKLQLQTINKLENTYASESKNY